MAKRFAPRAGSRMPPPCNPRWKKRVGTATGIAAATSTTAHRSDRPRARNAVSTRLPSPGASFPAPQGPRARHRRWPRSTGNSSNVTQDWRCSSHRRSTAPRWNPAISKAIRPAFARTAANIRTRPRGRSLHLRGSARQKRRPSCFRCSIRSIARRHARTCIATRSNRTSVAADIYSVAPHIGRGGWTWYTGSAGWMYRAGLESILGFRLQGDRLRIEPCIPSHWPRFEIVYRHHATRYEIAVENPDGVSRGVCRTDLDGVRLEDGAAPITLVADGDTHRVSSDARQGRSLTAIDFGAPPH